mmetsp:Transcript_2500/g.3004  ORF Transcript_2500/g.3004 Transcript_2500/m.3004 type:complete len:117 (+) Transcript_2500:48-398(+)
MQLSLQKEFLQKAKLKKGEKLKFVDDPAPTELFKTLASVQPGGEVLGKSGASKVVLWLRNNVSRQSEYLIIISDLRPKLFKLRDTIELHRRNFLVRYVTNSYISMLIPTERAKNGF